jgi:glucokinase
MSTPAMTIGIDIGGTKIALAAVESGRILRRTTLPTDAGEGFPRALGRIVAAIRDLLAGADGPAAELAGIGIGCAGPVNPRLGTIDNPYTLAGWAGVNIVAPLEEAFRVPVRLENDADAAALGEWVAGAARGCRRVVMFTVGTGIGSGTLIDGTIYRGAGDAHPEAGHIVVDPRGPSCYCGRRGCLEAIASGTAIAAAGLGLGARDCRDVIELAARGNQEAGTILARAAEALALGVWNALHTLLPERVVLGGGIMDEHYALFEKPIAEMMAQATLLPQGEITLARALLGNDAGLVGAAQLPLGSTRTLNHPESPGREP